MEYYKQLLDGETGVDDNGTYAREVFLRGALKHVSQEMENILDVDIFEKEVEFKISHLANDKSSGWNGLTNDFFKKYVLKSKGILVFLFQKVWSSRHMPQYLKVGLIKLLPKKPSLVSFC